MFFTRLNNYLTFALVLVTGCALKPAPKWPSVDKSEIVHACWGTPESNGWAPMRFCMPGGSTTPIVWAKAPLVVSSDSITALPVMRAVDVWNEWVGFKLLVYDANTTEADILVLYGGSRGPSLDALGMTIFQKRASDNKIRSFIPIFNAGLPHPDTYLHELGHAIGLSHDPDNHRSIMFTSLQGMFAPGLEKKDRALLRRKYLPGV